MTSTSTGSACGRALGTGRVWFGSVLTAMTVVLCLVIPQSAYADTPQPDGPPDGGDHTWCYRPGFNQQTAADAAMTRLRNQTDVTTRYPGACGKQTDVRWLQGDVVNGYGQAICVNTRPNGDCEAYSVTLDMAEINAAPRPVDQRTKTSCHEIGHTVGVRHYDNGYLPGSDTQHSCMRTGPVTAGWADRITIYGNHHRSAHINNTF